MSNKFESLQVFRDAHELVLEVYKLTKKFPAEEKFGLTSQLKRSVSSVPANIIEGNSRNHKKEYLEFLYFANSSLEETKYHLMLAKDLQYLKEEKYVILKDKTETVSKQIRGLINYLKNKP